MSAAVVTQILSGCDHSGWTRAADRAVPPDRTGEALSALTVC